MKTQHFFLTLYLSLLSLFSPFLYSENTSIQVNYELVDEGTFHKLIVGNTVVGITRQSNSLYKLYFAADGVCELWKQQQIYSGSWWINKNEVGQDVVHAFWPNYQSTEPKSLFSPENPRFGNATSVLYYFSPQVPNALMIATKSFQLAAIIAPGRQLNNLE